MNKKIYPVIAYERVTSVMKPRDKLMYDFIYYGTPPSLDSIINLTARQVKQDGVEFSSFGYTFLVQYPPALMRRIINHIGTLDFTNPIVFRTRSGRTLTRQHFNVILENACRNTETELITPNVLLLMDGWGQE